MGKSLKNALFIGHFLAVLLIDFWHVRASINYSTSSCREEIPSLTELENWIQLKIFLKNIPGNTVP